MLLIDIEIITANQRTDTDPESNQENVCSKIKKQYKNPTILFYEIPSYISKNVRV